MNKFDFEELLSVTRDYSGLLLQLKEYLLACNIHGINQVSDEISVLEHDILYLLTDLSAEWGGSNDIDFVMQSIIAEHPKREVVIREVFGHLKKSVETLKSLSVLNVEIDRINSEIIPVTRDPYIKHDRK